MEQEQQKTASMAVYNKVSEQLEKQFSGEQIAIIHNSVAKGTSQTELAYFLNVAKSVDLNPFNKEVWCYKDRTGNLIIFAGRDGMLRKAQSNPFFDGLRSSEYCEGDNIVVDIPNGKIQHTFSPAKPRGSIMGAYAIVFRKGGEPTIVNVDFNTYNRGVGAWKTHPATMIKKVAEAAALKAAFGFSSLQLEDEFIVAPNGTVTPLDHSKTKTKLQELNEELAVILSGLPESEAVVKRGQVQALLDAGQWCEAEALKMIDALTEAVEVEEVKPSEDANN